MAAMTAIARRRASPVAVACTVESTCGVKAAAPTPCIARSTMSEVMSGANPAAMEAIPAAMRPTTKTRRRPRLSPSRPNRISAVAKVAENAARISVCCAGDAESRRATSGTATFADANRKVVRK